MPEDYNFMSDSGEREKDLQKIGERRRRRNGEQVKKEIDQSSKRNHTNRNENLKIRKDWKHSWISVKSTLPENDFSIRDVDPEPFNSPILVKVTPFIVNSIDKKTQKERKKRRGVPNAWAEYLATKDSNSDVDRKLVARAEDMGYNNIRVTDMVWNQYGISLSQGIPEHWASNLSEDNLQLENKKGDVCLCLPIFRKEEKLSKCESLRDKFCREIRRKSRKQGNQKCPNFESRKILDEIATDKKKREYKEKRDFGCGVDFQQKPESQNRICQSLQESSNIIQCEISGKIKLKGDSFNGIGSLKLNCGQNGTVGEKQKEESPTSPGLYQNICNQFSRTSKIREMITNFEPSKQISKLKKAFNGKKCDQIEMDFGEEKRLVCYECSCPYLKVLTEKTWIDHFLKDRKIDKPKSQNEKKTERIACLRRIDRAECKGNEKQMERHLEKNNIKNNKSSEYLKRVKVNVDKKKKKNLNDKVQCGCEIHQEDNTDSGNNADISQLSKCDELSWRESAASLTCMTRRDEKSDEKSPSKIRERRKKTTRKKQSQCFPCGREPIKSPKHIHPKDSSSDLAEELSSEKFPARKFPSKPVSKEPVESSQINRKQKLVSYASDAIINVENKSNFEKRSSILEFDTKPRLSKRNMQISNSPENRDRNSRDDLVFENYSNNSNEKLLLSRGKNRKSRECSANECRKRGGAVQFDFWSSDSAEDEREVRKNAWCEKQQNSEDSFVEIKINPKEDSDLEQDNEISSKVLSSLLEESLDLISEPIGRRKISDFKISEKKSRNEIKCYTKYCYDRSERCNWDP